MASTLPPDYCKDVGADVVITATGGVPIKLNMEGDGEAIEAKDALLGKAKIGEHVLVIGGGLVGSEVALWLSQQGKQVEIAEMMPFILGGPHSEIPFANKSMLSDLLKYHKVQIHTGSKVLCVNKDSAILEKDGNKITISADTVIMAVGYKADDRLYNSLKDCGCLAYNIGDSRKFHNVMQAIWDAFEVANAI